MDGFSLPLKVSFRDSLFEKIPQGQVIKHHLRFALLLYSHLKIEFILTKLMPPHWVFGLSACIGYHRWISVDHLRNLRTAQTQHDKAGIVQERGVRGVRHAAPPATQQANKCVQSQLWWKLDAWRRSWRWSRGARPPESRSHRGSEQQQHLTSSVEG